MSTDGPSHKERIDAQAELARERAEEAETRAEEAQKKADAAAEAMADADTVPAKFQARAKIARAEANEAQARVVIAEAKLDEKDAKLNRELKKLGSKRGVETMFRTSYRTNMDLSSLADAKANIMISINGLIVTFLIASIAPGIDTNPWLRVPTTLLLLGCMSSLLFAVLAARPRVQSKHITLDDVKNKSTNLLFFGNFAHLSRDEFVSGMEDIIIDGGAVYRNMMLDIYGLGLVLQKKYRLLRISYTLFMAGLSIGVLAFIITFFFAAEMNVGIPETSTPLPIVPGLLLP